MLSVRGLGKDYGARTAVKALDLEVARGECVGLLGPNGAGKTTAISMICGVVTRTRGSVAIAGHDLATAPFAAKARLGLVPQDLAIYEELTPVENLEFFGALYGLDRARLQARIAAVLDVVGLSDRAGEPARRFSGGMKRRLNLAAGLLHEPELLILDEPTVGVDPQSRNRIFETVKRLHGSGTTIIYTSHYMEEVEELCDRVAIIDGGAIIADGAIADLVAKHTGRGVELELAGDVEAAVARVTPLGEVTRTGSAIRVVPHGALAPVIAAIEEGGASITRIESHEANLEAVFLALTGHELRDER
ncbi:MAG: ABC transporter ATP-binding protein [Myxococcales bacterium]|nr:ABC transporter ATP-binding protein [Myxococcales bacterium]